MRPTLLALLALARLCWAQGESLPSSETLSYRVEWRLITAGRAKLEWNSNAVRQENQIRLHLESVGLVSALYKVQDDYASTLNRAFCALTVQSTTREGNRQRETSITFDAASRKADYVEKDRVKNAVVASLETDIPPCVHDVIGGIFYLRTLNIPLGQSVNVPVSDGKKSVSARVEAQRREEVKTSAGKFQAVRHEIFLFNNVLYRRPAHLYVWLTDDARRLPVQIQVKLQFTTGTITFELEKRE